MLDKWCEGKISQKSAEAPINIFLTKNISYSLGGVGNFMRKFEIPKVKHHLFSEVGKDNIGLKTIKILKKEKIKFHVLKSKQISTLKERLFIKNQQVFRKDFEYNSKSDNFLQNK